MLCKTVQLLVDNTSTSAIEQAYANKLCVNGHLMHMHIFGDSFSNPHYNAVPLYNAILRVYFLPPKNRVIEGTTVMNRTHVNI